MESGKIAKNEKRNQKGEKEQITIYAYKYSCRYNILCSGARYGKKNEKRFKKREKSLEKGVDKREKGWYYSEAVARDSGHELRETSQRKTFLKKI